MKTKKSKIKTKTKTRTRTTESSYKKTGVIPKDWVDKLIKEHKVLVDGLKDR